MVKRKIIPLEEKRAKVLIKLRQYKVTKREELKNAKGQTYKLVGEVLIEKDKKSLQKELQEAKDKLDIRIKALDKQEKSIRENALEIQKEVTAKLK